MLLETAGPPTRFPFSSASFSLPCGYRGQQFLSIGWMQISASDSFSCLLGLLEGSHDRSLFVPLVSGLGTSPWARSHIGPVVGPSFPQAPLHFHPCNSFRQEQLWVRDVTVGWQPHPSLDVLSSLCRWALYVSSPYCQAFHQRSLLWVLVISYTKWIALCVEYCMTF